MDESDVLQHLLHVENEAAMLAADAQSEADGRIAERERRARETYSARYGAKTAELDAEFKNKSTLLAEEYNRLLDAYRSDLEKKPVNEELFASLALELLFEAR